MKFCYTLICLVIMQGYFSVPFLYANEMLSQESIVGTWKYNFEKKENYTEVQCSHFPDNTFESVMVIKDNKNDYSKPILMRIVSTGTWSIDGNVLIENINNMSPKLLDMPKTIRNMCSIANDGDIMSCAEDGKNEIISYKLIDKNPKKNELGGGKIYSDNVLISYAPPNPSSWWVLQDTYDKSNNKHLLMFKRLDVNGENSKFVEPVILFIAEKIPNGLGVYKYSAETTSYQQFDDNMLFDLPSFGDSYPNALFLTGKYGKDSKHVFAFGYFVNSDNGIQVICDSVGEVNDEVMKDFNSFLQSIKFQ